MPRFAANLSMMFQEHAFLDRFAAAAAAGFAGVEFLFPYEHPAEAIAGRLREHGLTQALFNPPGDWAGGERGLATLPGREEEFRRGVGQAIGYARALGCGTLHAMAGLLPDESQRAGRERLYADNLRFAAGECAAAGLILLIEPINTRDIPGYFLNYQDQARRIIEAVVLPTKLQPTPPLPDHGGRPRPPRGSSPPPAMPSRSRRARTARARRRRGQLPLPVRPAGRAQLREGWVGCEYRPRAAPRTGWAGSDPTDAGRRTAGGHGMARQPSAEVRTAALGGRRRARRADDGGGRRLRRTLDAPQRPHALHRFDGAARRDWGYTPRVRPGLPLRAMREAQRKAAWTLVDAALSAEGAAKARASWRWRQSCRSARPTGPTATPRTTRSPCSASQAEALVAVRGPPRVADLTVVAGDRGRGHAALLRRQPALGPSRAGRPRRPRPGAGAGIGAGVRGPGRARPAAPPRRDRGRCAAGLHHPPRPRGQPARARGHAARRHAGGGRERATALLDVFFDHLHPELAEPIKRRVREAGLGAIRFAWAGADTPDRLHYYRLHGLTLLIEYDKTDLDHAHSVWHDPTNLFGEDHLRAHHEAAHAHR